MPPDRLGFVVSDIGMDALLWRAKETYVIVVVTIIAIFGHPCDVAITALAIFVGAEQ